jgi:hypothetical protein
MVETTGGTVLAESREVYVHEVVVTEGAGEGSGDRTSLGVGGRRRPFYRA